jgi:hypothetical protein
MSETSTDNVFTIKCAYCWKEGYKDSFSCFCDMTYTCKHCDQISDLEIEEIEIGGIIFIAKRQYE